MLMAASNRTLMLSGSLMVWAFVGWGCADQQAKDKQAAAPLAASVQTLNEQELWELLIRDRTRMRRTVKHTGNGIETLTESDDAAVAARLIKVGTSLQSRVASGASLRPWDPAFIEPYRQIGAVRSEVVLTAGGIRTVESSSDVATLAVLLEHAMSVSDCVRQGPRVPGQTPARITVGETLPAPEVAIGGVPHRFLLSQPDASQLSRLKEQGVDLVVNYRHAREHADYNEQQASSESGLEYCNLAYMGAAELTDQLIDASRASLAKADRNAQTAALHCRTGNRVGPGWAAYRTLDGNVPLQQAIDEAKAMQMLDPMMESATREYIRNHRTGSPRDVAWKSASIKELSTRQAAQYQSAVEARDLMFSRLFAALSQAMTSEAGVAGAIGTCKEQAPRIAQTVAAERGVMIGRTGTRQRNPGNVLPRWAAGLASDMPAEPRAFTNPDGSLGVTLPIRMAATCLACHGEPAQIDRVVAEAIAAKYPKDQATGYREGELRGVFWIEVPAK